MAKRIQVGGRIESKEVGGIVTGAAEILDDAKGKKQSVINQETDDELLRLEQSKQDNLTFDNAPTEDSDNPVKSGGVYAADKALSDAIEAILLLIPSAASALNKLVDTAMMNSSISTATATFKGTYNVVTDLSLTIDATHEQIETALGNAISMADNNDYAFVQVPVSAESTDIRCTERYKFNGTAWGYEYDINTSGFTAAQWAAINSGITLALVGKLIGLPTSSELQALLGQKQDTLTFDNVPTAGSANPVKSGGVYSAINDEKTAREQLAQTVTGIDGRVGDVEEVIPTGAAANNKLVANNSMEAYVTSIIEAITASFTISTADGHINFTLTQTNGRVASITLTSSDIASAQALTALTGRVSTAESNITSLGGRVSTNETDIAELHELYNSLQQSKPAPVTELPSTGQQQGVIYRLAGTTSYSDYMWNGSTWVLMATYNNAIDPRPKKASLNLVTSGGVFDNMGALDVSELNATENPHTLAQYVDLSAALAAIPTDYQKGGMSIKYVQSSDNKYVQYRLMANSFTTDVTQWQNTDTKLLTNLEIMSSPIVNYRDDMVAFVDANPSANKLLNSDGTEGTYQDYSVSSFIPVVNTKQYYYKGYQLSASFLSIAFYDANQNLLYGISGDAPINDRYYSLRFPNNVKYFRVSYLTGDNLVFFGTIEDGLEKNKKTATVSSINLFDYTKANVGYITSSGTINNSSSFFYSDYIPVKYGDVLKINNAVGGGIRCEQYDYNFNFIQGTNEPLNQGTFTIVQNAKFFRFSGYQDKIKETMCVIGELPSIYVPFNASGLHTSYPIDNEMFFVPCGDVLLENLVQVSSTFTDGIFGGYTGGAWETSDYIDISVNQTPFYLYLKSMYRADLKQVEFYDKDKNIIKTVLGRSWEFGYNEKIVKINPINGCQYIRFSRVVGENGYGVFKFNGANLQEQVRSVVNQAYTENKNLIWIGTSIPAGATYPQAASSSCGYNCLNKAVGSSHLCFRNVHPEPVQDYSGYELTATVAELEAMYRQDVTDGVITEEQLNLWKAYSYENSLIPYINGTNDYQISMLVLDHGINDHAAIHAQMQDVDNIDWESRDRATFVGAFNYLMDKLFEVKHTLKIVIAGHYENKWDRFYAPDVCKMQELLAERYGMQIMKTWEYTQINTKFMKGTSNYLTEYNQTYGTSWTPEATDAQGNIMTLQVYMPDILHPHSDLTGNCNKRLNAVFSKLLKNSI